MSGCSYSDSSYIDDTEEHTELYALITTERLEDFKDFVEDDTKTKYLLAYRSSGEIKTKVLHVSKVLKNSNDYISYSYFTDTCRYTITDGMVFMEYYDKEYSEVYAFESISRYDSYLPF